MNIKIMLNRNNGQYKLTPVMNKQEENIFFDLIISNHSKIKSYNVFIKNGTIYSYNLEDIKKVKNILISDLVFKKLKGKE